MKGSRNRLNAHVNIHNTTEVVLMVAVLLSLTGHMVPAVPYSHLHPSSAHPMSPLHTGSTLVGCTSLLSTVNPYLPFWRLCHCSTVCCPLPPIQTTEPGITKWSQVSLMFQTCSGHPVLCLHGIKIPSYASDSKTQGAQNGWSILNWKFGRVADAPQRNCWTTRTRRLKDRKVSFASESLRVMVGTISISSLVLGVVGLDHAETCKPGLQLPFVMWFLEHTQSRASGVGMRMRRNHKSHLSCCFHLMMDS